MLRGPVKAYRRIIIICFKCAQAETFCAQSYTKNTFTGYIMRDRYGRDIDYLRISITDKCNLRCKYCMPGDIDHLPMSELLTYEEISYITGIAVSCGIKRIKITGGEPLVRRGCCKLIKILKDIPGIEEVTITTNGVLLEERLEELRKAGIDGINISIDTLDPERYERITGADELDRVLRGMDKACDCGIRVKINAVSVDWSGLGDDKCRTGIDTYENACELISLSRDRNIDVRFIEMMPIGSGKDFMAVSHDMLIPAVKGRYPGIVRDDRRHGNGPSVYYRIPGHKGSVGFISAIHGPFCDFCNRIRLTSQGYLKSCLCFDTGVDLKALIRSDRPDILKKEAVRKGIEEAILCKPKAHSFTKRDDITEKHAMSAIGG